MPSTVVSLVDVRMWMVFFTNDLKCFLGIHGKIDRRLVHVDNETPVTIAAAEDEAHELHEVKGLVLNFDWRALGCVCIHSIGEKLGNQEVLHTAAAHCEALCVELG